MGRAPSSSNLNEGMNKGAWTAEEDALLIEHIKEHGEGRWGRIAKQAGIKRCGKSCRLRWLNYLRPDIKRGNITQDEEDLIIRLHRLLGNRWSLIAGRLPGRTDNEIKNYWNSTLGKRAQARPKPNPSPATESAQPAPPSHNLPENREAVAPPQPMPKPSTAFRAEPDGVVGAPEQDDRYGDGGAWASLNSLHEDSGARKWAAGGDDDGDSFSSGGSFAEGCLRWKVGDHTVSDSEFWDMLGDWMADDGYGSELA